MGIAQKAKSLYGGVPGGGAFQYELDPEGRAYLPFKGIPYELEDVFAQWADKMQPPERSELVHVAGGAPVGVTVAVWEEFLSWMLASLQAALNDSDTSPGMPD